MRNHASFISIGLNALDSSITLSPTADVAQVAFCGNDFGNLIADQYRDDKHHVTAYDFQHIAGELKLAAGAVIGKKEILGEYVEHARQLVAEGKGTQKSTFFDYEGKKGVYAISTTPANYLDWFEPGGAMRLQNSVRQADPHIPVLWIVAKNDYPSLRKTNIPLFEKLPHNALTRFYESDSDHLGAPSASLDEIVSWTTQVASSVTATK